MLIKKLIKGTMNTLQQEPGEGVTMKDKTQEDVWGRHPTEVEKHEHLLKKLEAMMDENPPENSIAGDILGDLATAISLYEDKCDALATARAEGAVEERRQGLKDALVFAYELADEKGLLNYSDLHRKVEIALTTKEHHAE